MDGNRFASRHSATFGIVILFVVMLMCLNSCSERLTAPPERTIDLYYKGYREGDRSLISSTMLGGGDVGGLGLGLKEECEIVEKRLVLESKIGSKTGDVQTVTHTTVYRPQGPLVMITTFILRKVGEEWKIAGLYSEGTGGGGRRSFLRRKR